MIPSTRTFGNVSPRPLRRTLSARGVNDVGSSSPRVQKITNSTHSIAGDFYGDSISAVNVPVPQDSFKRNYPPQ